MFNITLESKYQLNVNSGSNGCQVKYLKDIKIICGTRKIS